MKVIVLMFACFLLVVSCSESEKEEDSSDKPPRTQIEKTPTAYANEYCECMLKYSNKPDTCLPILIEAQDKFAADNIEAEKEFTAVMNNCNY